MKRHPCLWLILSGLLLCSVLGSSKPLSLDDCINIGMVQNTRIQTANLDLKLELPARLAAIGQFLPAISAGYGINQYNSLVRTYVADDGRVITLPVMLPDGSEIPIQERKSRSSNYYLQVSELFFDGGRSYQNLKNSRLSQQLREERLAAEGLGIRSLITTAYSLAISAQQYQNLADEIIIQRRRQLKFAEVRFETGSVTKRDVLLAEVELGRAINDSLGAENQIRNHFHSLNITLGFPTDSLYHIEELPPVVPPTWNLDSLITIAVTNHCELKSSRLSRQISGNNLKAAKGDFLPQITGSISYSRSEQSGENVDFTLDPRNRSTSYNLNLNWLLFDRFSRTLRLQEARINTEKSLLNQQQLEQEIRKNVIANYNNLKSLFHQSKVTESNIKLARETLKFEEERYRLGSATTLELGTAQLSYIQSNIDNITLKTQFYISLGELEAATGLNLRKNQ